MSEATARPWKWLPNEGQFITGPDMQIVAEVPCQGANPIDGELIVTAVNERDALLAERDRYKVALEHIANHPHQSYENGTSIDLADGHRCAGNIVEGCVSY